MTDLANATVQRMDQDELAADVAFMKELASSSQTTPKTPDDSTGGDKSIIKDIGHGLIELPMQTVGGVIDGLVNDTSDLTFDLAGWLNKKADLGHITWDKDKTSFEWEKGMPSKNVARVPSTPRAKSTTGGIVREISNFVSLFAGVGKLKAFKQFQAQTKTGQIAKGSIQGFVADFVNKPDSNLSNLIQKHPTLENPVNEWLACESDCDEMDKRLRTALEGLGVGAMTEGLIGGLRILKQTREFKQKAIDEEILPEDMLSPKGIRTQTETVLMGKKADPLVGLDKDIKINWSRIDADKDVEKLVESLMPKSKGEINKARRGVRSWKQTALSAEQKNAWSILESLNKRGPGATLNAEESVALRELWVRASTKLNELAQEAAINTNPNVQFQFQKMLNIQKAIQEKVIAVRTEAARTLNSWKIPTGANLEKMIEFDQAMQQAGGVETSQALAKKLTSLQSNPGAMDTFVRGSTWATTQEAAAQLWYFSLLSNPHTHMRNFISNSATTLFDVVERKAGSYLGSNIAPDEASAKMIGMVNGFKDAFRITARGRNALQQTLLQTGKGNLKQASDTLRRNAEEFGPVYRTAVTGQTGYGKGGKLDIGHQGHVAELSHRMVGENLAKIPMPEAFHKAAAMLDTAMQVPAKSLDALSMLPSRSLQTADELFKTINYQGELHAQATMKAWEMVKKGDIKPDQIDDLATDFISNPDEFMRIRANKQAEYLTFTNMPPYDSPVWQAIRGVGRIPLAGRVIMPFTRVVYNIGAYTFERTPMAPFVRRWRRDMEQGGRQRDLALAKMSLGTMALAGAVDLSMRGHIVGVGSPDVRERSAERRMGVQPNSVRIGDRFYSFRGLEPIASPLGIAANLTEILAYAGQEENTQADEIAIAASLAIGNQLISQQYMMGLANLFDAMSDPTRKGEGWFNSLAKSMVPAGVGQYTRSITDPALHQVENMIDAMKSRIPGLSAEVPYTIDLWGRRVNLRSGLGQVYDILSPIYSKQYDPEPIDLELKKLGYYPAQVPRKLSFDGVTIDMEDYPKAWERLKELAGNDLTKTKYGVPIDPITRSGLKDTLNRLVQKNHPGYPFYNMMTDGPDGGKAAQIKAIVSQFRSHAKDQLLEEFPDLKHQVNLRKADQKTFNFETD